ncbi:MAG: hypothetical protein NT062_20290 [Proteobacteria bacterium]|nr:hypothetical protein [Pseudomonadota bacterium]
MGGMGGMMGGMGGIGRFAGGVIGAGTGNCHASPFPRTITGDPATLTSTRPCPTCTAMR